jgi:hypothetical protein
LPRLTASSAKKKEGNEKERKKESVGKKKKRKNRTTRSQKEGRVWDHQQIRRDPFISDRKQKKRRKQKEKGKKPVGVPSRLAWYDRDGLGWLGEVEASALKSSIHLQKKGTQKK